MNNILKRRRRSIGAVDLFSNTYSISFDGSNDFLDIGDVTILDGLTTLTVSFWINFTSLPGTYNAARNIIMKGDGGNTNKGIAIRVHGDGGTGNGPRFGYQVPGNLNVVNYTVTTSTWYHCVVTMASAGFNVYVNGSLRSSADVGTGVTIANISDKLCIGGQETTNPVNAIIDEVAIFNDTKNLSTVQDYYNSGAPTNLSNESGLIGYWRMEEGTGTTVADSSSNSNTATLTNSPTWSSTVPTA